MNNTYASIQSLQNQRRALGNGGMLEYQKPSLFSFSGRLGRIRYIVYSLIAQLIVSIFGLLMGFDEESIQQANMASLNKGLFVLAFVSFIWYLSITVQRMHDFNMSGMYIIPAVILSIVMLFISPVIAFLMVILSSLALLAWPGTRSTNDYGAPTYNNQWYHYVVYVVFFIVPILIAIVTGGAMIAGWL
ncbi:DUF805 domain-containing protein [Algicola sagamiensis]|uniref:DUF805 domain-containing protein n=1 Tax=Algicola sagamiensis TaxID=163869 RepID=UPI0003668EF1|nr:DUF805 domain-containing protein [Algicola sagamiensis]